MSASLIISALLRPIIGLFTAVVNMFTAILQGGGPLLTGIAEFIVWYFKTLYRGFITVLNNLHVLLLIFSVFGILHFTTVQKERYECRVEVEKQKKYDAQRCPISKGKFTIPAADPPRRKSGTAYRARQSVMPEQQPLRWPGDGPLRR